MRGTLAELASLATEVGEQVQKLDDQMNQEVFNNLLFRLNYLHSLAPNCLGVQEAFVSLYRRGFEDFEDRYVGPFVRHEEGWLMMFQQAGDNLDSPSDLLMGWDKLMSFFARKYLGNEAFAEFFKRMEVVIKRLVQASESDEYLHMLWSARLEHLIAWMLAGGE
ncbi:MAG: hypothetical protein A2493_02600 [Candidatus Magasanikbacteria bacterium RIFOXYC12_FULL_33_11]|uniref:Uncharacterized protein n=1 Tax=Candidatus Magasanikbacteria bacterium RIFOXYC12_FULL_33_11 TaxID=1798701 RepID=A0A1F6NQ17_9BACT|nr:MAG: hypothetical protein A2493_02600 [Candidatus Magasanikbacteria bacterium RIFOXYC12_FULL_33_11]